MSADNLDIRNLFPHTAADHNGVLKARLLAQTMNEQVRMTGVLPRPSGDERREARDIFEGHENLPADPSAGTLAHLSALIGEFDREVVMDAASIRNYVTNSLIAISTNPRPQVRLRALEMLGKITDVALFSERREMHITSDDGEMIKALRERLKRLQPVDVTDVVEIPAADDDDTDATDATGNPDASG